LYMMSNSAN